MDHQLLDLVARLYAVVQEPDGWPSGLAAFVEHFGAEHAVMVASPTGRADARRQVVVGADPGMFADVASPEEIEFREPYNARLRYNGRAVSSADLMSDQEVLRSVVYNEVIKQVGGFYALLLTRAGTDASYHLALCRGRRAGAFPRTDVERLQLLVPHLTTAVALHDRLAEAEARADDLTRLLDRMSGGVILTDELARPSFLNARAAQILEEEDGLTLESGRLAGAGGEVTQRLRKAVATVAAPANSDPRTCDIGAERPSGRLALLLHILPVWRLGAVFGGMPAAKAAIFLKEPDMAGAVNREALADMFRLTSREIDVAELLAHGTKAGEIAVKLGIGGYTVRQHLNRAFEKTGIRHQAGLVALIRSLDRA